MKNSIRFWRFHHPLQVLCRVGISAALTRGVLSTVVVASGKYWLIYAYFISHRIYGAGIYANKKGVY